MYTFWGYVLSLDSSLDNFGFGFGFEKSKPGFYNYNVCI